jgi:hypothetical protein
MVLTPVYDRTDRARQPQYRPRVASTDEIASRVAVATAQPHWLSIFDQMHRTHVNGAYATVHRALPPNYLSPAARALSLCL